jgi:hypothetical protein
MNEYTLTKMKKCAVKIKDGYNVPVKVGMFNDVVNVYVKHTDKLHAAILSDLVNTNDMDLNALKAILLFHYTKMCGLCDWGGMRGRDNPFKILTPDDAYNKSALSGIAIYNPDRYRGRWCIIGMTTEWETEHGVYISIRNGIVHGLSFDYNIPFIQDNLE